MYSSITFFLLRTPPSEPFIGFGIFPDTGTLSQYFQTSGSTVSVNQTLNWHLQVTNKMGSVQFVRIVFRLENETLPTPNETGPAATSQIGEATFFVLNGENSSVNFDWRILRTSQFGNLTFLALRINGQQLSPAVGATAGNRFRFIFELWTLDNPSGSFRYGWQSQNGRIGSWLQIWFNTNS